MTTPRWLEYAARRAGEQPWALGTVLEEYCRTERVTRDQLSSLLGCSVESLAWLSLCRRPAPERFAADVARIAARFQIDPANLAQVVRRVDSIADLRGTNLVAVEDPVLLAARDRDEEDNK